jgi:transcriptional regulator with XRE-family HTH domain
MSVTHPTKSPLGSTIKALLLARGLKAYELGEAIGLSATSVSKIMNGVSRPRQNTFTRMCQELCTTKDEEQRLVSAFAGTELLQEEAAPYGKQRNAEQEVLRMRAEQFLERKTQSIQFKRSVARELDKAGIAYQQDYCQGPYSTDFLIEHNGQRIALECKSNIGRDLAKTEAICKLIKAQLSCNRVRIVVPYLENDAVTNAVAVSEIRVVLQGNFNLGES